MEVEFQGLMSSVSRESEGRDVARKDHNDRKRSRNEFLAKIFWGKKAVRRSGAATSAFTFSRCNELCYGLMPPRPLATSDNGGGWDLLLTWLTATICSVPRI